MAALAEKYNDVVVIAIEPELTGDTIEQFRSVCNEQLDGKNLWFVVDMEKTASLDSSGLETLLWFRDEVEGHTGLVKICTLDPICQKVFELTRFDRKFEVFETVTDAITSYE